MSQLIVTIAVGHTDWAQKALNLALSIRANTPDAKLMLICEQATIKSLEPLIEKYFDICLIQFRHTESAEEFAFYLKTRLYETVTKAAADCDKFLFLDADTIMTPSGNVNAWFDKHSGRPFTSYCNDILDLKTGKRKRRDYTFWCDPKLAQQHFGIPTDAKMPQVNSSYLYFERCDTTKRLFDNVMSVWDDDTFVGQEYKGTKPDELCFNVACALNGVLPHQNTYRPIFFQFGSELHNLNYINQYFKAFGFAGTIRQPDYLIGYYNSLSDYYRWQFGVIEKWVADRKPLVELRDFLKLEPVRRKTLYREGEVNNSGAGIFNPAALTLQDRQMTVCRKEKDFDAYKRYKDSTGIPHITIDSVDGEEQYELELVGFEKEERLEDFRLFMCDRAIMCNHTVVANNHTPQMEIRMNVSYIAHKKLVSLGTPALPIDFGKIEKNWVFFGEGNRMWCIYSLAPYRIFYADAETGWGEWYEYGVEQPEIKFAHKGVISNSTNPVRIDDYYLMFFHTKEAGIYYKGALLIDAASKNILHYTKKPIQFDARNDGMHKNLHYVSGALYLPEQKRVRVYYGENDSHACFFEYSKEELFNLIING